MAGLVVAAFLLSMGNKPKACVSHIARLLSASDARLNAATSAPWKYKILALSFALLMAYLLFCAVMCAIAASGQGDGAFGIMLFSIIITYGGTRLLLCCWRPERIDNGLQYTCSRACSRSIRGTCSRASSRTCSSRPHTSTSSTSSPSATSMMCALSSPPLPPSL